jgi:poly-gamma-glutamate synthesis protein (capsule biosynthesis protein)
MTAPRRATGITRRQALSAALALPWAGLAPAGARDRDLLLALIGQCLVRHDLRRHPWPGYDALAKRLRAQHACFTDLEVALTGPRSGAPTRAPDTVHTADPVVLDCLRDFGVTLLATSNNHAFDVGTGGILDTMAALRARGLAFAGTGETLAQASAPAFLDTRGGRVALVAAAAGMVRDGGAATAARAGVHEIRRGAAGGLHGDDVERMLESLRVAARRGGVVLAYLHNHLWEPEVERTADWQREFARRCIDAGANLFAAHGPPLLHGIETYRGAPLFHGLGSFIFQTRKAEERYDDPNWESLVVECRFEGGRFRGARLSPVQLARVGVRGPEDLETRGRPSPATPAEARATLARLAALSGRLGHRLTDDGRVATLAGA